MHVLFLHQNFPAQFGHIAAHLIKLHDYRCTFVSEKPAGIVGGIERIQYKARSGARKETHYCSRTFENQIWHSHAVFEALEKRSDIQPDLVVAHSGFTSSLYLRELYDCPIINYFEYFYRTTDSDIDFRSDLPGAPRIDMLRARTRNAMLLLDLNNCDLGYSPTDWQRGQLPHEYQRKLRTVFDGVDTSLWHPMENVPREIAGWKFPADKKLVTYVSRGMEASRGFDIFMKMAKRICDEREDVIFAVVGEDRIAYGGDSRFTEGKTFKQWVLSKDDYNLSRILFLGRIPPTELARLFSLSDLHVYLTVPFVLSWSLMNALACGTTVMASDTAPVREMVKPGNNGFLFPFFDVDKMVATAHEVLNDPSACAPLGREGTAMIQDHYSLDVCLPKMVELYREAVERPGENPGASLESD